MKTKIPSISSMERERTKHMNQSRTLSIPRSRYSPVVNNLKRICSIMNKNLLPIASLVVASSLHAVPLTWHFTGTTGPNSTYQGTPIENRSFDFKIFLDTTLNPTPVGTGTEVNFFPPGQ